MTNKIINATLNVIIFIVPLLIIPIGYNKIPYNILKISVLLLCGLILLITLIVKRKELKFDNIDKTLLVLYILIFLSTIFSINLKNAIFGAKYRYEGFLTLTCYLLTYYTSKYYFKPHTYIEKFAIIVVWITSIIGILQYHNLFFIYNIFKIPHVASFASSTFGNTNFFGSFLAIIVPTFMALYITKNKKIYLFTSYISFFAMLATTTRSSWVGLFFASIFGFIYVIKNRNKSLIKNTLQIVIGFIIIFAIALNSPKWISKIISSINFHSNSNIEIIENDLLQDRLDIMNTELQSTIKDKNVKNSFGSYRIEIWNIVLGVIPKVPLLGTGPDTLAYSLIKYSTNDALAYIKGHGQYIDKAHNEYLQVTATMGIPALIIYLIFLGQILVKQKNMFKDTSSFILVIPIISYICQAFFNISTIGVAPIFWCILGLIQNIDVKKKLQ